MKKVILALSAVLFSDGVVHAADKTDGVSSAIAVRKMICQKMYVNHKPSPDVAYQPGVDVNGNQVAPADINATPVIMSHYIEVPLNVDLAQRLNSPAIGQEMNANLGSLKLYDDGRVLYNDQDITQNAMTMCGNETPANTAPVSSPSSENDVIPQPREVAPMTPKQTALNTPDIPLPASAAPSTTVTGR